MKNKQTTYTNLDVELVALWERIMSSENIEDIASLHKQIGKQVVDIYVKIRDTSGSVAEQNKDWLESDFFKKVKQINAKFE